MPGIISPDNSSDPKCGLYVNSKKFERRLSGKELIAEVEDTDSGIEGILAEHGEQSRPAVFPTDIQGTFMVYSLQSGFLVHSRKTEFDQGNTYVSNAFSIQGSDTTESLIKGLETLFSGKGYAREAYLISSSGARQ
jgi:hypothetical protein